MNSNSKGKNLTIARRLPNNIVIILENKNVLNENDEAYPQPPDR